MSTRGDALYSAEFRHKQARLRALQIPHRRVFDVVFVPTRRICQARASAQPARSPWRRGNRPGNRPAPATEAAPAAPAAAPDPAKIVATIDGQPISEAELALALASVDQQYAQLPPEQRRAAAFMAIIEIRLLAAKAVAEGLDKDADFQRRMAFLQQRALHSELIDKDVGAKITDAEIRARYDKQMADTPPVNEVKARHILVKTKEEAVAIIKELDGGADFEKLANEKTNDPSGKTTGGDLGYFGPGQMVPEFEKAAFALDVGAYTKEPVQTQFGWHVIKVEDKRAQQPPAFEQVKDEIRNAGLSREIFRPGHRTARRSQGRRLRPRAEEGCRRDGRGEVAIETGCREAARLATVVITQRRKRLARFRAIGQTGLVPPYTRGRSPMSASVSPLAPKKYPEMPVVDGVRMATAEAGIKYKNRTDVLAMVFDAGTQVAGVFTRSKCPSAPVDFCRQNLAGGSARLLVVNSGNANAFTGKKGRETTDLTGKAGAQAAGCSAGEVFLASTGVIGEPLDAGRFSHLLSGMVKDARPGLWREAASAIMTTDTYPKVATVTVKLGEAEVTINGIAKGAGMIAPDMATMLSFVATDAPIAAPVLQSLLSGGVGQDLQRHHRRQRHVDQRHAAVVCDGRCRKARRAADRQRQGSPACGLQARPEQGAEIAGAAGRARRRGRAQAGRGSGDRREIGAFGQAHRALHRQFAAGQDGDRRRGRQLGPRRDGGRQGRRACRPRPSVGLVRRQPSGV